MTIEVGSIVEGVVTGITNFGAFIELPGGKTGLVHISEVADSYVKDVKDYLKDKDRVMVKIITVDKGKIGLSIKQAQPAAEKPRDTSREYTPRRNDRGRGDRRGDRFEKPVNFEDRLTKFMKESDERQQDIRRSTDSKRGGRGSRRA